MSEGDPYNSSPVPLNPEPEEDGPPSAYLSLPVHLQRFVDLTMQGKEFKEAVEILFPSQYVNPADAGHRWYHRKAVQAAIAELRAEAIRKVARDGSHVLKGMWEVADRCMQKVRPVLNRKGEQVTTETPEGEALAYEFDANGAMRAYESLAEYHGMAKKQVEFSGTVKTENKTFTVNTNVPDDPVEAARFYRDMIQADKSKK